MVEAIMNHPLPPAAVVIPAHNEGGRIRKCLSSVVPAALDRGWEVIVVDDGSTDDTAEVARSEGIKVISNPVSLGVAAARNLGARSSKADIILFVDADVVPAPSTLHKLADRLLTDQDVHATAGHPTSKNLSSSWSAQLDALRGSYVFYCDQSSNIVGFSAIQSGCCAFRRSVFEEIGGFPERYRGVGMEEFELGHEMERRGYVNVLLADAPYDHHWKGLCKRSGELVSRTSRWVPLLLRRARLESPGAVGSPLETTSCGLSGIFFLGMLGGLLHPSAWWLAAASVLLQIALEWRFLRFARRTCGVGMALFAWPGLQMYHAAILLGFVPGLVRVGVRMIKSSTDHAGSDCR
jgi:hypothetical protein